ncbi:MAG: Cytochrome b6-f complex iron-sulfur subunit [Phycisphaerae bacterium]|nr:Cytochrome b6-f complex iron-sulfur subunit [Phycisphaerae bacterium]
MANQQVVKVSIDAGCIVCDVCETAAPTVFHVADGKCVVRPEALNAEFLRPLSASIQEAADRCPVSVIKCELAAAVATAPAPAAAPKPAAPAPRPAAARPEPAPAAAKAAPYPDLDPTMRKLLETTRSRGGTAGIEKGAPVSAQLKDTPLSKLPPDARFLKMMEAGKQAAKPAAKPKPGEPTRRDLLVKTAGWGTFALGSAVGLYGCGVRFMFPNVLNEPEKRIRVAAIDKFREMPPGGVNEEWKPQGIWIVRVEDQVAALSTTCTHLGCIPSWLEADRKFKCPCHGSGFKQTGINFEGPAPRPLERYKVSVEDGILIVDKGRKFQFEKGEWENPESYVQV